MSATSSTEPDPAGRRWAVVVISTIAACGGLLRLAALLPSPAGFPADYDEGVYSAAASLLLRGQWPYADYVFVHPPGIVYLLAPLGALDPTTAFAGARLLSVAAGVATIALIGATVHRRWGLLAATAGASLYAVFPEAVYVEHGVFLEPWLNLLCVAAVACWLNAGERSPGRAEWWALAAGGCIAAAGSVKLWAAAALLALVVAPPSARRLRCYVSFAAGIVVTAAVLWLPVLVRAPGAVIDQVVLFQAGRPEDGVTSVVARLEFIFSGPSAAQTRHVAATVLAIAGVVVVLGRRWRDRLGRIAVCWLIVLVGFFLLSATYWDQYNAALAPSMSLLGAAAASVVPAAWRRGRRSRLLAAGAAAVLVLAVAGGLFRSVREILPRSDDLAATAADIAGSVPADACVVAFEPGWLLAADRLPDAGPADLLSVDPYAAQLGLVVREADGQVTSTGDAFAGQPAGPEVYSALSSCRYLLLGWRGHWQLSAQQQAWVSQNFRQLPTSGPIDLWERI